MTNDTDHSREHGIEFGSLAEDLEAASYPLSQETLLDQFGDRELELVGDPVTLREVLSPQDDREYADAESVQQAVVSMVGDEAIGRENYSDRGGSAENIDDSAETESF